MNTTDTAEAPVHAETSKDNGTKLTDQQALDLLQDQMMPETEVIRRVKEEDKFGDIKAPFVFESIEVDGEQVNLLHFANPHDDLAVAVTLRTFASQEYVEKLAEQICAMPETCEMLCQIAEAYQGRNIVFIEGGTALGKTFAIEKFTQLVFGEGPNGESIKPLDFYCNGQTDVSELMAKWVPKTESSADDAALERYLGSDKGRARMAEIQAIAAQEDATPESIKATTESMLTELAKEAGVDSKVQWEFQLGALPKAMCWDFKDGQLVEAENGSGFVLHIEEIGLAKPAVINALLQLGGSHGKHADSIQLWQDGGRTIHMGPRAFIACSTNQPEDYLDRNELDPALARRGRFFRKDDLSPKSYDMMARRIFTYTLGNTPETPIRERALDLQNYPEIGLEISDIMSSLHKAYLTSLKHGEKGRQQKIPATGDDLSRAAEDIINLQVRKGGGEELDLPKTVMRAFRSVYLERLADQDKKEELWDTLKETMHGDVGKKEDPADGTKKTRAEILDRMVSEAHKEEKRKSGEVTDAPEEDVVESLEDIKSRREAAANLTKSAKQLVKAAILSAIKQEVGLSTAEAMPVSEGAVFELFEKREEEGYEFDFKSVTENLMDRTNPKSLSYIAEYLGLEADGLHHLIPEEHRK